MAIHHFQPTTYYSTMGSHPPALHLAPGDTVITTTVDAWGVDAAGQAVTAGGNPQTGPFFVDGAEPGDALVVRLDRIAPSRPRGASRTVVAPNVVDPAYARELPASSLTDWAIDRPAGVARLVAPPPGLAGLSLPLAPMLGCFGVAPAGGQAISTATSGPHGGNMDYRGFVAGATVYFPVFVPGALFHLGDGHAIQGAGEIVGTGIEISMDVEFRVELRKGWTIAWPRGENAAYLFTVGNARPLDQAVQHATTEMLHWLAQDYGLDTSAASTVLGQCVEYDLGNIFDPAYTMVCKIPKQVLASLAVAS